MQVRKKPITVEARQTGVDYDTDCEILAWSGGRAVGEDVGSHALFIIPTLEGEMIVSSGDWVIQGVEGEFYPCKPDIFAKSYEEVTV